MPGLDSTEYWLGVRLLSPVPATVEEAWLHQRPPAYRLSENADSEVLVLRLSGGLRLHSLRYRLFGDGRLLREVLNPGRSSAPVLPEEVRLPRWRVLELFDAIVRADMLSPGNRTVLAGLSSLEDGTVANLTLDIEEMTDATGGTAALHETVTVPDPHMNGQRLSRLRVLHVFLRVLQMLDAPFERRGAAVLSDAG
jgi:3',5'-cyclic AMP phosphodiesterase CpdA